MHLRDWNVPSDPTSSSLGAASRLLSPLGPSAFGNKCSLALSAVERPPRLGASWVFKSCRPLVFEGPLCCPPRMGWSFVLGEEEGPGLGEDGAPARDHPAV